jgi:large repetitive protein
VFLGSVTDSYASAPSSDYSASIDWGDNRGPSKGDITPALLGNGQYEVRGTHSYHTAGNYTIVITVSDAGGASTVINSTIQVADAQLVITPVAPPTLSEGNTFNGAIATCFDANPFAQPGDFQGTIDWGNGPITQALLVPDGNGSFTVAGSNTYAEESPVNQPFTIVVTIVDRSGTQPYTQSILATIVDAPLTPIEQTFNPIEATAFNGQVAVFQDGNPQAPPSDFTATINWGNGITSAGTIQPIGGGQFGVSGTNTYAEEGSFPVSVSINDIGGSSTIVSSKAVVLDAPLTFVGSNSVITVFQDVSFSGPILQFSDGNVNSLASDFTA